MNNSFRSLIPAMLIIGLLVGNAAAEEQNADISKPSPPVEEIVSKTNLVSYYQGADGRTRVAMVINDAQGRERSREFTILRWDAPGPGTPAEGKKDEQYEGDQKFYVYFQRPADVNKMVFMVWKHLQGDDDRWLYMPALDLVKRIAAKDKRTSFVGSHFLYEDVSGRHVDADQHELVETTENYFVLKNTPRDADSVEFSYYKMWIHRKTFLVVQTAYYDKQGKEYRAYKALEVENIQGYPTVTKSRMTDDKMGGFTEMSYTNVEYNIGMPEDVFAERYLRKAPYKYLR